MKPITWREFREDACLEAALILERTVDESELISPAQAASYLESTGNYTMPGLMACDYAVRDDNLLCCLSWDEGCGSWIGWLVDVAG